ncbi:MAG: response regulator [Magnetococcales bacterium]|nr:response regulator [Magnetococcales bacterium]
MKAAFESTRDAMLMLSTNGKILRANTRFREMWRLADTDSKPRDHAWLRRVLSQVEKPAAFLHRVREINQSDTIDRDTLHFKDGRIFDRYSAPLLCKNGMVGRVWIFTNITERRLMEKALLQAQQQAEEASRAKGDFLAAMSHEIRTPMNVVLGLAEMLLESKLTPQQHRFAKIMHQSGKALLVVINDILDFSRIEAGGIALVDTPFSPRQMLKETMQMMRMPAMDKGLTLEEVVSAEIPDTILGDDGRVRQVLINLLGNAIKFTHQGGVTVSMLPHPQEPECLLFKVVDTGIGIAPEQMAHIFDQFSQANARISRSYGGTGLGLAICRRLVELMGGRIWVESQPNQGSTFFCTLPMRRAASPVATVTSVAHLPPSNTKNLRILLAEDVEENQVLFEAYLMQTSHQVVMVNNGKEALDRVKEDHFDVIFMDVQMPIMDGHTATRQIRQWEQTSRRNPIPIIVLSAHAMEEEKMRSQQAGSTHYLSKPFQKSELFNMLQQVDYYTLD